MPYDNSNKNKKRSIEQNYRDHIKNEEVARTKTNEYKKKAEENINYVCATFDLQQVSKNSGRGCIL